MDQNQTMRYGDDPATGWGHPARVFDLAFSPLSADVIASGAEDGTARVWRRSADDPHTWKQTVCCYGGHPNSEVLRVAWHPNGRLLATGGAEGAVRLWRADGGSSSSTSAALTYAPPIDPLASEHPEEIYAMIFASRSGGAAAPSSTGTGSGDGAGVDVAGGELLVTASAEALYLWDLETGKLLQGAPAPKARLLGTRAERVPMPPWRGPRTGRGNGGEGDDGNDDDDNDDDSEQQPPPNYPKEMPVYVFGMAQVGGGAPPAPSLLAAGCCDGTLRLWAFQASAARLQPLFGAQAHAPGEMASFVHVLQPQAEDTPAGGGSGAVGAGGPYIVSVSRGGHASVFDARRLVAAGSTAGTMTLREALSAGVVQRHWLDGPTMGGAVIAASAGGGGGGGEEGGGKARRPLMLAAVGADGRVRCYEARALLQPPPPEPPKDEKKTDEDDEDDDDGPPVLRPARILRCPAPALHAPLLAAAASADGSVLAAAGFPVEAGSLSREEQRLRYLRTGGGGEGAAGRSAVRRGGAAGAAVAAAGRRRRGGAGRPAVGTAVVLGGGGVGGEKAEEEEDDGSGLFAALTIGTAPAAAPAAAAGGGGGEGEGEEGDDGGGDGGPPPKCEAESVSARAAVFVWRMGD